MIRGLLILGGVGWVGALAAPPATPAWRGMLADGSGQHFDLESPAGGGSKWLSVGDTFAGWKLVGFRPADARLVLESADEGEVAVTLEPVRVEPGSGLPSQWSATFDVGPEGQIAFNGRTLLVNQLPALLITLHDRDPRARVLVAAGESASAGALWNACRQAGLTNISIALRGP